MSILEAMQIGCPVVTSNVGAMLETAGNAAVLVDPENTDDIKGGIEEVISDRQGRIDRGRKRAREFSWEKTASDILRKLALA